MIRPTPSEGLPMNDLALIDKDIDAYLERHENKELLRFVTVGSVDDGKSTLIGRLLRDTGGFTKTNSKRWPKPPAVTRAKTASTSR